MTIKDDIVEKLKSKLESQEPKDLIGIAEEESLPASFDEYCAKHPSERLWHACRLITYYTDEAKPIEFEDIITYLGMVDGAPLNAYLHGGTIDHGLYGTLFIDLSIGDKVTKSPTGYAFITYQLPTASSAGVYDFTFGEDESKVTRDLEDPDVIEALEIIDRSMHVLYSGRFGQQLAASGRI